jgi:hypothetical protein
MDRSRVCVLGALVLLCAVAREASSSTYDEARRLRDEGRRVLDEARGGSADEVKLSKEAIAIFEKAAAILENCAAGTRESVLLEDLNSLIFWTRRTTPLDLAALRSTAGAPVPVPVPAAQKPAGPAQAVAALARAEEYAAAHPDDPMTIAARFFEIADTYRSIHDVAFKAISRAQEFQGLADRRKALSEAEAAYATLARDEQSVVDGDRAFAKSEYDAAAASYLKAIAVASTPVRNRKLGHARFNRAQQYREEYSRAYLDLLKQYQDATRRNDKAAIAQTSAQSHAIKSIASNAKKLYSQAEESFGRAWVASNKDDIDSEMHKALCFIVRTEKLYQQRAAETIERVLRFYYGKLKTDEERTLYALAQSYAGPEVVRKISAEIAARTPAETVASGADADALAAVSDDDLRSAVEHLTAAIAADETKLQRKQSVGTLDRALHEKVVGEKKRLKALRDEVARRGL